MLRSLSHDFSRQLKPSNGYAIFISGGKRKDPGNEGLWYNSLVLSPLRHELNMFNWCGHWGKDGGWVGKIYKHNDKSTYAEKERKNPHAGKDEKEKYCFPAKSLVHKQLGESINSYKLKIPHPTPSSSFSSDLSSMIPLVPSQRKKLWRQGEWEWDLFWMEAWNYLPQY